MQRTGAESPPSPSAGSAWVGPILGVAVICAGVAYPVTAAALRHTSASVITTSRALVGGLVMLPVLRLVGARLPRGLRAWAWVLAISIGNVVLTLAGIAEGTRLAGAAIASVLLNSAPFFAALFARMWLDEHLTGRQAVGLVVGFAGILLIVGSPNGSGSDVRLGIVICLSGALGWAAAGLGMRYLSTHETGFDVYGATTAQFLCGGVLLVPYLLTTRPTPTDWSSPSCGPASSSSSSAPRSSPTSASTSPSATGRARACSHGRSSCPPSRSVSKRSRETSPTRPQASAS